MNETLMNVLALVPALVFAIVFHEVSHGWVALMLGDPTAKERRRLSLNPVRHVDPVGTLFVPGALALLGGPIFGWAKPVPVIKHRLRNPRFGMMAVAAAGPLSNLFLATVGAVLLGLLARGGAEPEGVTGFFAVMLQYFLLVNVFLAFFNLLPIPPFDGSHIVEGALPRSTARAYERLRPIGMLLFLGLVAITWLAPQWGVLDKIIGPPVYWALAQFYAIAQVVAGR